MAAMLYAVHPDKGFFETEAGAIQVTDDGALKFAAGSGNHKTLRVDSAKREKIIQTLVETASAKPQQPQQRVRPPQAVDVKKAPDAK